MSADIMLAKAREALSLSYSPYSAFQVACCIRTTSDDYILGTNIENASYGLTLCAEACAIAHMIMLGKRQIAEVLVIADCAECVPCGACRQRIHEFAARDTLIHTASLDGIQGHYTIDELLPHAFNLTCPGETP